MSEGRTLLVGGNLMDEPDKRFIRFENDGPLILKTNYWQTPIAKANKLFLSINAGAFRLLLPTQLEGQVREMRTATMAIVSRGPWPKAQLADALEILFDDGTQDPYCLHLTTHACDRLPLDENQGGDWSLTAWGHLVGERPRLLLDLPCGYRRVRALPDLRPWEG